jgi:hypothetical protein
VPLPLPENHEQIQKIEKGQTILSGGNRDRYVSDQIRRALGGAQAAKREAGGDRGTEVREFGARGSPDGSYENKSSRLIERIDGQTHQYLLRVSKNTDAVYPVGESLQLIQGEIRRVGKLMIHLFLYFIKCLLYLNGIKMPIC